MTCEPGHTAASPTANNWPPSAPSRSEAKNRPPRKPEPSETIEASVFSTKIIAIICNGNLKMPVRCSAPWPDDMTCGEIDRQQADQRAADHRPQRRLYPQPREQQFAGGDAAHQDDAEHGGQQAEPGGDHDVVDGEVRHSAGLDAEPAGVKACAVR